MIDIIKNFFTSQWGGMISGLLTSAFIALLKLVSDYIATTKNEYSGAWVDAVYDKDGKIEKVDIWKLRYNNHTKRLKDALRDITGLARIKNGNALGRY